MVEHFGYCIGSCEEEVLAMSLLIKLVMLLTTLDGSSGKRMFRHLSCSENACER